MATKLTVAAPGGRKVAIDCESSATFGDVKLQIERLLGVPPDKQRLLCSGKERKNPAETLAAAGVSTKSKLMLMLAPGYTMPDPPAAEPASAAADDSAAALAEVAPVNLQGSLPLGSGVSELPAEEQGTVHIKQARNRYQVRVPQGLAAANFGELADYLTAELLSGGIQAGELRFLSRGKNPDRSDALAEKGKELTVMLLFKENFHIAEESTTWLRESVAELAAVEADLVKLAKRVEANLTDAETSVRLAEVGATVEVMMQSVESLQVREANLPETEQFRKRVLASMKSVEALRKSVRL